LLRSSRFRSQQLACENRGGLPTLAQSDGVPGAIIVATDDLVMLGAVVNSNAVAHCISDG
jgi:hypothetical protein